MKQLKMWMLAAILVCGTAAMLTSCVANEDNSTPTPTPEPEGEEVSYEKLEIDPGELQPIDIPAALLGSMSSQAEDMAAEYWFTNLTREVTDETMVVITDEITAGNEAAIADVLKRYGMLLLVDPNEANVRQYAEALGVDPNAEYSNLELLGLSGFGDQFLSYTDEESIQASADLVPPLSIADADIWDIAPSEYLRLKAFAVWVENIEKKYTDYLNYVADLVKANEELDAEIAAEFDGVASRSLTRVEEKEDNSNGILDITKLPGIDRSANIVRDCPYESFKNKGRDNDKETCHYSVTCNYHFIPLYRYPTATEQGADYYVVETSLNWDLTETVLGFKKYDHGIARDRRSWRFFPHVGTFYSTPVPTSPDYGAQITVGGDLYPKGIAHNKSITNSRSFNIDGNLSGGSDIGMDASGPSASANSEASLGIGANWSKEESFEVEQWDIAEYVSGASAGHTFTIPGGEDGYRPRLGGDDGIEVPNGVSFKKTLHTGESWIWKIGGTKVNTSDASIKVKFTAKPTVAWYSYFYAVDGLDCKEYTETFEETINVPAPYRVDAGFIKIAATSEENGKKLHIFGIKATDVTDSANPVVIYDRNDQTYKNGKIAVIGLPANKKYQLEITMGPKRAKEYQKTYVFEGTIQLEGGSAKPLEYDTDIDFVEKK